MFTPVQPIPFPLVNGHKTDHSSLDLRIDGTSGIGQGSWKYGLKSISWDNALEPGEARGAAAQVSGLTRGQLKSNGSLELWKADADNMERQLYTNHRAPLLEIYFSIQLIYKDRDSSILSNVTLWVRITKQSESSSNDNSAHAVKYDLYILGAAKDGIPLVSGMVVPGVSFT